MSLLELFCLADDFWQAYEPKWKQQRLATRAQRRVRRGQMGESEMVTILIPFHQARYRDFKTYYTEYVAHHLRAEFPRLLSYGRFIQRLPMLLEPVAPETIHESLKHTKRL